MSKDISHPGVLGSASTAITASTVSSTSDAPYARADASPRLLPRSTVGPTSERGSLLRSKRVLILNDNDVAEDEHTRASAGPRALR